MAWTLKPPRLAQRLPAYTGGQVEQVLDLPLIVEPQPALPGPGAQGDPPGPHAETCVTLDLDPVGRWFGD